MAPEYEGHRPRETHAGNGDAAAATASVVKMTPPTDRSANRAQIEPELAPVHLAKQPCR